jgi:low temperature requirement protein LtrA
VNPPAPIQPTTMATTLRAPVSTPAMRVSTLELFFDLVFVFTITQVTHLVTDAHDVMDLLRAFLVLAVTWWMYDGYAWLTNNVGTEGTAPRLLLLVGMAGFLVMALATRHEATRDGLAFGLAYLAVVLVHAGLFMHAPKSSARAMYRVAPFNVAGALLVVAAGLAPARWNLAFWIAALLTLLTPIVLGGDRGFQLRADHFAERHGAIILIALGESVAGLGIGAGDVPVGLPIVRAAVLGLALAAALWWSYFDRDDIRGEHALTRVDPPERARLSLQAYWFAHLLMIAGIVVAAAGLEGVITNVVRPVPSVTAWRLAAGVAVYLAGEAVFRRVLRLGPLRGRLVTAGLAVATAPIGLAVGYVAQLTLIVLLLTGMLTVERRTNR